MNPKKRRQLRRQAFENQNCRCFYCQLPMWEENQEQFARGHGIPRFTSPPSTGLKLTLSKLFIGYQIQHSVSGRCHSRCQGVFFSVKKVVAGYQFVHPLFCIGGFRWPVEVRYLVHP